jgi:hypothetical protein
MSLATRRSASIGGKTIYAVMCWSLLKCLVVLHDFQSDYFQH